MTKLYMPMKSHHLIFAALLSSLCVEAQVFTVEGTPSTFITRHIIGGSSITQTTIDPDAGTASVTSEMTGIHGSHTASQTITTIVPGQFPNVTRYVETFSITYTHGAIEAATQTPPAIPDPFQGSLFSLPLLGSASADIGFEYTLTSNGETVASGSGSYPVTGGAVRFWIDALEYPDSIATTGVTFALQPEPDTILADIIAPSGRRFVSYPRPLYISAVPEVGPGAIVVGVGLLALAGIKAQKRSASSRVTSSV